MFGFMMGNCVGAQAGEAVNVLINGLPLYSDVPPQVIDGRVMVPIRFIAEALGATVTWDEASNTAYITSQSESETEISNNPGPNDWIEPTVDAISLTSLYKPRTNFEAGYCVDQWLDGRPFTVLGVEYDKGVGFYGEIGHDNPLYTNYCLDGKYTKFSGFVALDDGDYDGSGFSIGIHADHKYCTDVNACVGLAPQPFEVDVTGAKMLNIEWAAGNCTYPMILNPVLE